MPINIPLLPIYRSNSQNIHFDAIRCVAQRSFRLLNEKLAKNPDLSKTVILSAMLRSIWCSHPESNWGPLPYQGSALPPELCEPILAICEPFPALCESNPTLCESFPALCEPNLERVAGIEPAQPAWKAGVLPLNYTRLLRNVSALHPLIVNIDGGGGWIRTTEACASDLQSDPFGHSGTPPNRSPKRQFSRLSHSGAAFYGNWDACAIVSQRFSDRVSSGLSADKSSHWASFMRPESLGRSQTCTSPSERGISSSRGV